VSLNAIALGHLVHGPGLDLGPGFLPLPFPPCRHAHAHSVTAYRLVNS
jgi:hypothetical protein